MKRSFLSGVYIFLKYFSKNITLRQVFVFYEKDKDFLKIIFFSTMCIIFLIIIFGFKIVIN